MSRSNSSAKVSKESVLAALRAAGGGGLRNVEIRRAIFGAGKEDLDQAGCATTVILGLLKVEGRVRLEANRWTLGELKTCAACGGKGVVSS